MACSNNDTLKFECRLQDESFVSSVIFKVNEALEEKGYDAVGQIVGYLLSGDPSYITSHKDARKLIRRIDRNELLEEMVRSYLRQEKPDVN